MIKSVEQRMMDRIDSSITICKKLQSELPKSDNSSFYDGCLFAWNNTKEGVQEEIEFEKELNK